MAKRFFSFFTIISLLLCTFIPVQAATLPSSDDISAPEITIMPEAADISADELLGIIHDHPNAGKIVVYAVMDHSAPDVSPSSFTNISYTVSKRDTYLGRDFVISVAKGQTGQFSKETSFTLSSSTTGDLSPAQIGINTSCTAKYSSNYTFSGPPESSSYNSRSYYIKWYGNTGTWKAYFIYDINPTRQYWVNGTFREVTRYVMYSVDERVS